MIRKIFKKKNTKNKLNAFIQKYNIPREYLSANRKSISRGLLIGIFWGFIPMPMQMVAVVMCTPLFRFNVPIAIATVWLSNPVTMPFMYYMEYLTGSFLLGLDSLHVELTVEWFSNHLDDIFVPLYVGTLFYSVTVSVGVYYLVNWLWIKSVQHEKKTQTRHQKRKENKLKHKS